ncbi:hypothetical protein LCGC14_2470920 [marine sediment metagenome]|uniref:Uncharacterized protein n=1 Tax=marine sediment metagenome TaxID=412755 RepID=A0A0F9BB47_9ZZZZ
MKWKKFLTPRDKTWFDDGGWNAIDDRSGEKLKASRVDLQWDGMRTRKALRRHEQDFIRSTPERIRTPWNRVPADEVFVNGAFVATNDAGSGSTET